MSAMKISSKQSKTSTVTITGTQLIHSFSLSLDDLTRIKRCFILFVLCRRFEVHVFRFPKNELESAECFEGKTRA
jgi:hypothetical protein